MLARAKISPTSPQGRAWGLQALRRSIPAAALVSFRERHHDAERDERQDLHNLVAADGEATSGAEGLAKVLQFSDNP